MKKSNSKKSMKAVALTLAMVMGLSMLTACGKSKKDDSTQSDTSTEAAEEEVDMEAFNAEHDSGLDPEEGELEPAPADSDEIDDKSNSRLVEYIRISPNRSTPRNHKIDTITIHCMAGQLSIETCGNVFANSKAKASSNYGIGRDGRIGLYVEEKDRAWCSSNSANDNRAVTIEVASDSFAPYAVSDKAYESLITLVTDICKRNGIKKLVWSTDKMERIKHENGCNMTVHRDFANKACPGDYLYNRMGEIADRVNENLGAK